MCGVRKVCKRMSCKYYLIGGGRFMNEKKKWYDYLWAVSLTYLILGFFNILFAWLGMIDFLLPLAIALIGGNKWFCNHLCGRGQLFALAGGRFGLSRKKDIPKWMRSNYFRYGFLIFFFATGDKSVSSSNSNAVPRACFLGMPFKEARYIRKSMAEKSG